MPDGNIAVGAEGLLLKLDTATQKVRDGAAVPADIRDLVIFEYLLPQPRKADALEEIEAVATEAKRS
eukprot:15473828-Alexandrium_andersonii.AAC.1